MLTPQQVSQYRQDGYLVLPGLFSTDEVAAMKAELRRIQDIDTDHLVRERSGGTAKTIYRVHDAASPPASPLFRAAALSPRLLGSARQLLDDAAFYIHHTKCNLKSAIDGSVWHWHSAPPRLSAASCETHRASSGVPRVRCWARRRPRLVYSFRVRAPAANAGRPSQPRSAP